MITQSQNSSPVESDHGVFPGLKWRAGNIVIICVIAVLLLLFSVQRVLIPDALDSSSTGQNKELFKAAPESWLRDTRIEERESHYLVRMSVPGIEKDELEVVLESGVLKVTGRRSISKDEEGSGWMSRSEMRSSFQKTCVLPEDVEREIAVTKIEDGVLLVKVSKADS
jgi:HSP20 family protein